MKTMVFTVVSTIDMRRSSHVHLVQPATQVPKAAKSGQTLRKKKNQKAECAGRENRAAGSR